MSRHIVRAILKMDGTVYPAGSVIDLTDEQAAALPEGTVDREPPARPSRPPRPGFPGHPGQPAHPSHPIAPPEGGTGEEPPPAPDNTLPGSQPPPAKPKK